MCDVGFGMTCDSTRPRTKAYINLHIAIYHLLALFEGTWLWCSPPRPFDWLDKQKQLSTHTHTHTHRETIETAKGYLSLMTITGCLEVKLTKLGLVLADQDLPIRWFMKGSWWLRHPLLANVCRCTYSGRVARSSSSLTETSSLLEGLVQLISVFCRATHGELHSVSSSDRSFVAS